MRWSKYLVWLLLAGLALVVGPGGETEVIKVITAEVGILILALSTYNQLQIRWRRIWPLALVGVFVLINTPLVGFLGNQFRLQGSFLLLALIGWSIVSGFIKVRLPRWLVWATLVGLLLTTVIVADNPAGRAVGTLGEPNALAAAGIFLWTLVADTAMGWWGAALAGTVSALAWSRSAILALAIQSIIYLFYRSRAKLSLGLAGLICILGLVLPWWESGRVWEDRTDIWRTAVIAGWQKPVWGWGFGQITPAFNQTAVRFNLITQYQEIDSAHNLFLDWWVQGGVVGLLAWVMIIGVAGYRLHRSRDRAKLMGLAGLVTVLSFNPASVVSLVQLWWLVGQGWFASDK